MVTVPAVNGQRVDSSPVRPNLRDANAPAGAFGASTSRAITQFGQQVGQVGDTLFNLAAQEQREDNERIAKRSLIEFNSQASAINSEFSALEGEAAVNAYPEVKERLEKVKTDILAANTGRRVSDLLDNPMASALQQVVEAANRHRITQRKVADDTISKAYIGMLSENYLSDPRSESAPAAINQIVAEVVKADTKNGILDPIAQAASVGGVLTTLHSVATEGLLATSPALAQEYYSKHKAQINPSERGKIEAKLETSTGLLIAQNVAASVRKQFAGNLPAQLDEIDRLLSGQEQELAMNLAIRRDRADGSEGGDLAAIQAIAEAAQAAVPGDLLAQRKIVMEELDGKAQQSAITILNEAFNTERTVGAVLTGEAVAKFLQSDLSEAEFAEKHPQEWGLMMRNPTALRAAKVEQRREAAEIKNAKAAALRDAVDTASRHLEGGGLLDEFKRDNPEMAQTIASSPTFSNLLRAQEDNVQSGKGFLAASDGESYDEFRQLSDAERAATNINLFRGKLTENEFAKVMTLQKEADNRIRTGDASGTPYSMGRSFFKDYSPPPGAGAGAGAKKQYLLQEKAAAAEMDLFIANTKQSTGRVPTPAELSKEAQRLSLKVYTEGTSWWESNTSWVVAQRASKTPAELLEAKMRIEDIPPQTLSLIRQVIKKRNLEESDDLIEQIAGARALNQVDRLDSIFNTK